MSRNMILGGLTMLVLVASTTLAQTVHPIPFASSGNTIELTVANDSLIPLSAVKVEAKNAPSWIRFVSPEQTLQSIAANGEAQALFNFSIDKSAPVNREQTLHFVVKSPSGQEWTKDIAISVLPPTTFHLFQNYPNPFNPTTTISFQLPTASHVSLKVYNLLGQEVTRLVDADRASGHHQEVWNAANQANGFYIYELLSTDASGNRSLARKAMLLVK